MILLLDSSVSTGICGLHIWENPGLGVQTSEWGGKESCEEEGALQADAKKVQRPRKAVFKLWAHFSAQNLSLKLKSVKCIYMLAKAVLKRQRLNIKWRFQFLLQNALMIEKAL